MNVSLFTHNVKIVVHDSVIVFIHSLTHNVRTVLHDYVIVLGQQLIHNVRILIHESVTVLQYNNSPTMSGFWYMIPYTFPSTIHEMLKTLTPFRQNNVSADPSARI